MQPCIQLRVARGQEVNGISRKIHGNWHAEHRADKHEQREEQRPRNNGERDRSSSPGKARCFARHHGQNPEQAEWQSEYEDHQENHDSEQDPGGNCQYNFHADIAGISAFVRLHHAEQAAPGIGKVRTL